MTDFLLELRSEEIPARMQDGARAELAKLFGAQMAAAGIDASSVSIWSTPRRLALIARGLPVETAAVSQEYKGPRTSAPAQALEGFLRKTGLTQDQLEDRDGFWFATVEKPGRATADVLTEAIPAIVRGFAWPKSMRWGRASTTTESLRWVRPLQGIVAIFGEELVPCEVDGIASGYATKGHRFHHSGDITIGGADDYAEKLRACHVIVDQEERRAIIRKTCIALTHTHGLQWVEDEALVAENAGLTEWPVPLLGDFDPAFLDVPPEVVRLTLAVNQKYFVASPLPLAGGGGGGPVNQAASLSDSPSPNPSRKREGDLAPAFICTANIDASDGGAAIVAGNRKVLAARLSDARFFWEQDKKVCLEDHAKKLSRITFHEKLGTVADKVERVAKLARWLVEEDIVIPAKAGTSGGGARTVEVPAFAGMTKDELATLAETAARLCKADLVTEMVGEFPELQGVMGGYYARAEGLPDSVADAIRDHYKPVGQGDDVPTAPVTVAVSLADKLDTIFQFFLVDEKPSGSRDPFALRRAAISIIALTRRNNLRWSIMRVGLSALHSTVWQRKRAETSAPFVSAADAITAIADKDSAALLLKGFVGALGQLPDPKEPDYSQFMQIIEVAAQVRDFLLDRLEVSERDGGARPDLLRAATILDGDDAKEDDLVRLLARVKALQAFVGTADGVNLLAGYKRAANILKKETVTPAKAGASIEVAPPPPEAPAFAGVTYEAEPAQTALIAALDAAEPAAAAAVEAERFEEAMAALATLRAPIDAFFDSVTVNDADPAKRAARLALLARLTAAVGRIADFSKIEG